MTAANPRCIRARVRSSSSSSSSSRAAPLLGAGGPWGARKQLLAPLCFFYLLGFLAAGSSGKALNRPQIGSNTITEWDRAQVGAFLVANDFEQAVVDAFSAIDGHGLDALVASNRGEQALEKDYGMPDQLERIRLLHLVGAARERCPVRQWKAHQVEAFVGGIGLMHDAYRFGDLLIDGADFLALTARKLPGLGVTNPASLRQLQRAVGGARCVCARPDLDSWEVRDVQEWLVVIGQSQHAERFRAHGINGRFLRRLVSHDRLRDIGIGKFADQEELIDSIKELGAQAAAIMSTSQFVGDIVETIEQVVKLLTVAGSILLLATNCCKANEDLHAACKAGNLKMAEAILERDPDRDLETMDSNRWTPLFHAAYNGHNSIIEMLIEKGADVNFCNVRREGGSRAGPGMGEWVNG